MEPLVALAIVAAVALGVLIGYVIAVGRLRRAAAADAGERAPDVPEAVDAVLQVLGPAGLVLGADDRVLRGTPAAYAAGLIRAGDVADPAVARLVRDVRADGEAHHLDLRLARGGGPPLLLGVHAAPLRGVGGEQLVLVLVEDRTSAVRIDEMRRDFVVNVSHELKTPVGAIALLAEALSEARDDPEAVRRFAASVARESRRLSELVRQITELSRLQYHDPLTAPEEVQVDEMVSDAVDRLRVDARARRIELASGGDHGLVVLGSRAQLTGALANLVQNAAAYSPTGSRVAVGVRRRDASVEIAVTDHGIGIPEHELERVFERFYRLDPARSRNTGGSGLGLSIVKHVAATHGGEVTAWSVEGTGSTFTLRLPLFHPALDRDRPPVPVPEATE